MRAVIQTGYGSADVMKLEELEKPAPGAGQVLVRVRAASLAAGEYFGMRGKPFPIRLASAIVMDERPETPGHDWHELPLSSP
jgi:NADPH:quinone reductase-like Zn-dependent oxidoreductase